MTRSPKSVSTLKTIPSGDVYAWSHRAIAELVLPPDDLAGQRGQRTMST